MSNIKNFEQFSAINEGNSEQKFKLFIKGGKLFIKVGEKTASLDVSKNAHIQSAKDYSTKQIIQIDAYQVPYANLKQALAVEELEMIVLDNNGKVLKDGKNPRIYLVITVPVGYQGEISTMSAGMAKGQGASGTRVHAPKSTSWGFYLMPDEEGLDDGAEIKPYKDAKFVERFVPPVKPISGAFERDHYKLTGDSMKIIEKLVGKYGKNRSYQINTGASLDGDPYKKDIKEVKGKKYSRGEWDYYLTNKRYQSLGKYLLSLGVKDVRTLKVPSGNDFTKNVYKKFKPEDPSNEKNRKWYITIK